MNAKKHSFAYYLLIECECSICLQIFNSDDILISFHPVKHDNIKNISKNHYIHLKCSIGLTKNHCPVCKRIDSRLKAASFDAIRCIAMHDFPDAVYFIPQVHLKKALFILSKLLNAAVHCLETSRNKSLLSNFCRYLHNFSEGLKMSRANMLVSIYGRMRKSAHINSVMQHLLATDAGLAFEFFDRLAKQQQIRSAKKYAVLKQLPSCSTVFKQEILDRPGKIIFVSNVITVTADCDKIDEAEICLQAFIDETSSTFSVSFGGSFLVLVCRIVKVFSPQQALKFLTNMNIKWSDLNKANFETIISSISRLHKMHEYEWSKLVCFFISKMSSESDRTDVIQSQSFYIFKLPVLRLLHEHSMLAPENCAKLLGYMLEFPTRLESATIDMAISMIRYHNLLLKPLEITIFHGKIAEFQLIVRFLREDERYIVQEACNNSVKHRHVRFNVDLTGFVNDIALDRSEWLACIEADLRSTDLLHFIYAGIDTENPIQTWNVFCFVERILKKKIAPLGQAVIDSELLPFIGLLPLCYHQRIIMLVCANGYSAELERIKATLKANRHRNPTII